MCWAVKEQRDSYPLFWTWCKYVTSDLSLFDRTCSDHYWSTIRHLSLLITHPVGSIKHGFTVLVKQIRCILCWCVCLCVSVFVVCLFFCYSSGFDVFFLGLFSLFSRAAFRNVRRSLQSWCLLLSSKELRFHASSSLLTFMSTFLVVSAEKLFLSMYSRTPYCVRLVYDL